MTTDSNGCAFCEIVEGRQEARMVLEADEVIAFFPDEPATVGHTLVIPRAHVQDIWSMNMAQVQAVAAATQEVAHAVRSALSPDGLNIIQSNGEAATQSVFHLHVHVLPRYVGDPVGPIWPEGSPWSAKEIDAARDRIASQLRGDRE